MKLPAAFVLYGLLAVSTSDQELTQERVDVAIHRIIPLNSQSDCQEDEVAEAGHGEDDRTDCLDDNVEQTV